MSHFNVAVVGGGPGGYVAAIRAARLGKTVALVEKRDLGGTCLNRGCIPTKALLHSAEVYQDMKEASTLGIRVGELSYDYRQIAARRDAVVKKLRTGVAGLLKGNHITVFQAEGKIADAHTLLLGSETITADTIILAMESVVDAEVAQLQKSVALMQKDDKLAIVEKLEQKGVFAIKNAVEYVADRLGVTNYTVYNYLKEARGINKSH